MDWAFCRNSSCSDRAIVPGLRDELGARHWLRRVSADPSKMATIRTFLAEEIGARNLYKEPDEAIVAQMARLLAAGQVHVHELRRRLVRSSEDDKAQGLPLVAAAKPGVSSVPEPRRSVTARSSSEPTLETPTFSDINVAAQAAALTAAAADGRPFCPE